ncbi:MAG: ABC transporter substrate-binding protein [Lachnospiraceae bacterium]|jgi:raffinose/stachyose/melibiose transport system substrate-binding protein|nr:ABC transporter substrate-binding protein [Lachnospiraceae bacterium]
MRKRWISLLLAAGMAVLPVTGCGTGNNHPGGNDTGDGGAAQDGNAGNVGDAGVSGNGMAADNGSVYYLNFKPEQADAWKDLAKEYSNETGIPVTIETAASGTYESTLKSEMAKDEAPTLFQVNGPVGLASWKDYCYDLKDSAIYKNLRSDDFALISEDGQVQGVAYAIETYGLIYNKALVSEYCGLDGAKIQDASEINSFAKLKEVADDMQARREELGIAGAFASAGMDSSSDWRFKTHLANLPIYFEYKEEGQDMSEAIQGTYLDAYRNIWDLYITDATVEPTMLSGMTGDDAAAEFSMGEAVFYQNGTWAYNDITGNEVADEDLGMLPIYIGVGEEENQGLCTGSENYWCVNKNASQEDIDATLGFLEWVITSDQGRISFRDDMGFVTPFTTFTEEYQPLNPLIAASNESMDAGKDPIPWVFSTMPSEAWKNGVGSALLEYAQGTGKWEDVEKAFVEGWALEYQAVKE